jgi:hypothetical protein
MASSYVNDLRLNEMATGDASGTWGTTTNTNLELIAEAFSYGTEAITTNADTHTTTIADGATDPGRSMYLKYTGTLDSACTITIGPNTVSKLWFIENATSGSQNIILSCGSGANITIPAGDTKVVYSDGAGAGAAFVDAFASINVGALTGTSLDISGDIDVDGTTNLDVVDIDGAVDMASTLAVAGVLTGASLDISGDIDVDGTTNLDVVDIDGAVDMATTLAVAGNVDFNGDLDVDGTTNLDVVDVDGAVNFAADVTFADGADIITASAGTSNFRAGVNAGNSIESGGNYNVVVGDEAGTAITTGDNNVAVGYAALDANTTAGDNTAVGYSALSTNTTGAANTGLGKSALRLNTTGQHLTAVGYGALESNTTGSYSTAVGLNALTANTEGAENTAIGISALGANTTGAGNTAVGRVSLTANTTANNNTAVGTVSLYTNTTGTSNAAVGAYALQSNTTASENTGMGYGALLANTTGASNTAVGKDALVNNTTQAGNTGVGWNALGDASSGLGRNTGIGYEANGAVTTGAANTALGWASGGVTTGNGNTVIGYITTTGSTTAENRIVIGYNVTGTANNRVHLGSSSGHVYNDFTSNATWTQTSDQRKKKDIVDDSLGLDFINDLRTTKYKFKAPSEFPKEWVSHNERITKPCDDKVHHGLIAQEVKQALDNAGVDSFEGWDELPDGTQQVSREMFVIPLIKAVQELSTTVDELKSELLALKGE